MAAEPDDDSKLQLKLLATCRPGDRASLCDVLTSLSMSLVMGYEGYLRRFDTKTAVPLLVSVASKHITSAASGDVVTLLWRTLSLILEHVPGSFEVAESYHKTILQLCSAAVHRALCTEWQYKDCDNNTMLEECLRVVRFVAHDDATGTILQYILVGDLLTLCTNASTLIARQALETLTTLTAKVVMPPDFEKQSSAASFLKSLFKSKKSQSAKEPSEVLNADDRIVVSVENVMSPFLLNIVEQLFQSWKSAPEMWSLLELALTSLGNLMDRSLISHRSTTAHVLVTKELATMLFRIIDLVEHSHTLEENAKNDRVLFVLTLLATMTNCHRELMADSLLGEEAKRFFKLLLDESIPEISTLLDDPFPRVGNVPKSTQRRDKDHITSMAAIRLFLLACPNVPPSAFGLRPKTVLPVHQWYWEDELHHNNKLVEEQCAALEMSLARLSPTASISVHCKTLTIDLLSMTMTRNATSQRAVTRSFVPFVYHLADEVLLRPIVAVKEAGPEVANSPFYDEQTKSMQGKTACVVINTTDKVPSRHVALGEMYLGMLCAFATNVPGQMAKQLATCACASLLQLVLISGSEKRTKQLLTTVMHPMCEMFREALISADKATKSVVLTMIDWMLHHTATFSLDFATTAARCGLVHQLQLNANKEAVVMVGKDGKPTRTLQLVERSAALFQATRLRMKDVRLSPPPASPIDTAGGGGGSTNQSKSASPPRGGSTGSSSSKRKGGGSPASDLDNLYQAIERMKQCATIEGVHEECVANLLEGLAKCETVTAFEVYQVRMSSIIMLYLMDGKTTETLLRSAHVYSSSGAGSTPPRRHIDPSSFSKGASSGPRTETGSPSTGSVASEKDESDATLSAASASSIDWACFLNNGMQMSEVLRLLCNKKRLRCLQEAVASHPQYLPPLVTHIVATLGLQNDLNLPLVESMITSGKVVCKTPLQAHNFVSDISPMVTVCGEARTIVNNGRVVPVQAATSRSPKASPMRPAATSLPGTPAVSAAAAAPGASATPPARGSPSLGPRGGSGSPGRAPPGFSLPPAAPSMRNIREFCRKGHRLAFTSQYATTNIVCDQCGAMHLRSGYNCRQCDFDICTLCYPRYEGNPEWVYSAMHDRAHLFATMGDIDRYFRTGSSTTKATEVAPTSQSFLHNISRFMIRVQGVLVRMAEAGHDTSLVHKLLGNEPLLRCLVYEVLASFFTRGVLPNRPDCYEEIYCIERSAKAVLNEEEKYRALLIIREGLEDRYMLYAPYVGLLAYNETFFSVLYRRAFAMGNCDMLQKLENCLVQMEGAPFAVTQCDNFRASSSPRDDDALTCPIKAVRACALPHDMDPPLGHSATFQFHYFESDCTDACSCGAHTRDGLATRHMPELTFQLPALALRNDVLLLILLHNLFVDSADDERKPLLEDTSLFVNTNITNLVVHAMEASALRVCVLPLCFAVPRWVNFILVHARFLLPATVRERLARFVAYGARRSMVSYVRAYRQQRNDQGITVLPGEWARLANHKHSVDRGHFLTDAYIALRKCSDACMPVSFEFRGDVGVGQGPTAQFYSLLAREVCRSSVKLWRIAEAGEKAAGSSARASPGTVALSSKSKKGAATSASNPIVHHVPMLAPQGADALVVPPPEGLYPAPNTTLLEGTIRSKGVSSTPKSDILHPARGPGGEVTLQSRPAWLTDYAEAERGLAKASYLVGAAVGRAFVDGQVFPLPLSPMVMYFLRRQLPAQRICIPSRLQQMLSVVGYPVEKPVDVLHLPLRALKEVDRSVWKSVTALSSMREDELEALDLPFTLPGSDEFELKAGGANLTVDTNNVKEYQRLVVNALLYESVFLSLRFMIMGCRDVVPADALALLDPKELLRAVCGDEANPSEPLWTEEEVKSLLVGDHGYQNGSPQIQMLSRILSQRLTPKEQRAFLLFCTGCPRFPPGGVHALGAITVVKSSNAFAYVRQTLQAESQEREEEDDEEPTTAARAASTAALSPLMGSVMNANLSVVDKDDVVSLGSAASREDGRDGLSEGMLDSDWALPSVNTCFRYLKLPPYPTEEMMYQKLLLAITQSGDTFELS